MTPEPQADANASPGFSQFGHMALAVTIGVSVTGFLIGVRDAPPRTPPLDIHDDSVVEQLPSEGAPPVVLGYAEMNQARRGPNANWRSRIEFPQVDPTVHYGDTSPTPDERQAALGARGVRRAFSGAPPVVRPAWMLQRGGLVSGIAQARQGAPDLVAAEHLRFSWPEGAAMMLDLLL